MGSPPSDLANRSKTRTEHNTKTIALWVLTMLTSVVFIVAAVPKLGGFGFFGSLFERFGYPDWLEMGVGIIEFVGAIFLIIPTLTFYAALALGAVMVGAIVSHLVFGPPIAALMPFIVLCVLALLAWARRPDALRTTQPRPSSAH